jgi:hypothetical protein
MPPSVICALPPPMRWLMTGRAEDLVVEDDGHAALHVATGELLEVRRAGALELDGDHRAVRLLVVELHHRGVDVVTGNVGRVDEVVRRVAGLVALVATIADDEHVVVRDGERAEEGFERRAAGLAVADEAVAPALDACREHGVRREPRGGFVHDLELEARGAADDAPDVVEGGFVRAGDLDDDVAITTAHGGFTKTERVDASLDGLHGLRDGGGLQLSELRVAVRHEDVEVALATRGVEAEVVVVLAHPVAVDLRGVRCVAEDEADRARADLADRHALRERGELLGGRVLELGVREDTKRDADLAEDSLRDAVALFLDVAVDLDLVHQAETATDVETRAYAAAKGVTDPLRGTGALGEDAAGLSGRAEARPERQPREHDRRNDDRESKVPIPIHQPLARLTWCSGRRSCRRPSLRFHPSMPRAPDRLPGCVHEGC